MKFSLVSLISGLFFGAGLLLSGMANPSKVIGFLDLAGAWDPSLALVMGGAILVGLVAFSFAKKQTVSVLGFDMKLPKSTIIDKRLIIGSIGFGIGWGLAGFCPGPALVAFGAGETKAIVFVAAMIAGIAAFQVVERKQHRG